MTTTHDHDSTDYDADREQTVLDARLAHVQIPDGATTDGWFSIRASDGDAIRSLEWSRYHRGPVSVDVSGWQDEHGAVTRHVGLYVDGSSELSAAEARKIAVALVAAADELDRLK